MNLIDIAQLRALCSRLAIDYVTYKKDALVMRFSISADINLMHVLMAVRKHPEIKVQGGNPPTLVYSAFRKTQEEILQSAVKLMQEVVEDFEALEREQDNPSGEEQS
jgi:transcription-repair coupling factor (superfamily II helicase)